MDPNLIDNYTITELNNMEWNYMVSPSQTDGKHCVHNLLFLSFIWLVNGVLVRGSLPM